VDDDNSCCANAGTAVPDMAARAQRSAIAALTLANGNPTGKAGRLGGDDQALAGARRTAVQLTIAS
jgi:hypothetical protein